jgi:hypothetical protein
MPDTLNSLAKRLARLERRVKTLERASQQGPPAWHDLPAHRAGGTRRP